MHPNVRRVLSFSAVAVAVAALAGAGLLLTGRMAIVATHGVSMNPVYHQGDLVVVRRDSAYRQGQIVAYRRPELDLVVLHRIVGGDDSGFVFQGDNNASVDPTRPPRDQLIGRAVLHIPQGGTWLRRVTAPPLLAAYAVLLLLGGGRAATRTRRRRRDLRTMPTRHRAEPRSRLAPLPAALRPVAAGTALIGVAGLALSGLAWTRPAERTVPVTTRDGSTMAFSYRAGVPRSAAYDGTTVTAPQPVFRRLANAVDVTYRYTGRPGDLTLSVELSTANGWTTRIPLGVTAVGPVHSGSVPLDLRALDRRAADAAKAIGLPAGQVTVAVVTAVRFDDGRSFTPRLDLVLDPLVLKPRGSLTAGSAAPTTASRRQRARLTVLGRSVGVATARTAGAVATGLAVVGTVLLAVLARLSGPVADAERIRARYRDLIMPVLPMPLATGRPVVDVPDIASLARLAERYGLLILHWSQGDQHTFVVQDEGATFRCRSGPRESLVGAARN